MTLHRAVKASRGLGTCDRCRMMCGIMKVPRRRDKAGPLLDPFGTVRLSPSGLEYAALA